MAQNLETLEDLYLEELRDLFHAAILLAAALPELADAVHDENLRRALAEDAARAEMRLLRLKQIFASCGQDPEGRSCKSIEGLLQEGRELVRNGWRNPVRDAGLIALAQKAQHFEIAGYGCASTFARLLGRTRDERLLQMSAEEEKRADAAFSKLANQAINMAAAAL